MERESSRQFNHLVLLLHRQNIIGIMKTNLIYNASAIELDIMENQISEG
jgi:hypothetical protein